MRSRIAALAVAMLAVTSTAYSEDARSVVDEAVRAMGATGLNAITVSGEAVQGNFGQSRTITFGVAFTTIRNYTRTFDFESGTARITGDTMPPSVPGGPPPQPGKLDQVITPASPWSQQHQIWITPWGFLRGAGANRATVKTQKIDGEPFTVVTWMTPQKAPSGIPYKVVGYINKDNLVARVETWVDHPVLGDEHLEYEYESYRSFGGVRVPMRVTQKTIGMSTYRASTTSTLANPPNLAELVPSELRAAADNAAVPALPPAASEKLADGVYRITGGYVSLAVEFKDYVVVLEGGQSEARGLAVLAETKRLFPGKRIKYVVNTHPHFDHASGLGPFVAEGITILADDNTKYFLEQALGTPRTLVGDILAKSKKKPKVEGVVEKMVLDDGTRHLELHHVAGLQHSDSMLIAWLPREKILFTADFRLPTPGQPDPSLVTLRENIERLQLDFDRVVMVHAPNPDRPVARGDLLGTAKGTN